MHIVIVVDDQDLPRVSERGSSVARLVRLVFQPFEGFVIVVHAVIPDVLCPEAFIDAQKVFGGSLGGSLEQGGLRLRSWRVDACSKVPDGISGIES